MELLRGMQSQEGREGSKESAADAPARPGRAMDLLRGFRERDCEAANGGESGPGKAAMDLLRRFSGNNGNDAEASDGEGGAGRVARDLLRGLQGATSKVSDMMSDSEGGAGKQGGAGLGEAGPGKAAMDLFRNLHGATSKVVQGAAAKAAAAKAAAAQKRPPVALDSELPQDGASGDQQRPLETVLRGFQDLRAVLQPPGGQPGSPAKGEAAAATPRMGRFGGGTSDPLASARGKKPVAPQASFEVAWKRYCSTNPRLRNPKALPALVQRGVPDDLRREVWNHCLAIEATVAATAVAEALAAATVASGDTPRGTSEPPDTADPSEAAELSEPEDPLDSERSVQAAKTVSPAVLPPVTIEAESQEAPEEMQPCPAAEVNAAEASIADATNEEHIRRASSRPSFARLPSVGTWLQRMPMQRQPTQTGQHSTEEAAKLDVADVEAAKLDVADVETSDAVAATEEQSQTPTSHQSFSQASANEQPSVVWVEMINGTGALPSRVYDQIEADVMRTYPNCQAFQEVDGANQLRRVLCTLAAGDPELGYCQSMNFLAATFIMVLKDESFAHLAVRQLLLKLGTRCWYTDGMRQLRADTMVLEELIRERIPSVHVALQRHRFDILFVSSKWFLCLFSTTLEGEALRRVWDVMLCDGIEAVFRIALAMMAIGSQAISSCNTHDDMIFLFQDWDLKVTPEKLVAVAYDPSLWHITRSELAQRRQQAALRISAADTRDSMRNARFKRGGVRRPMR